MIGGLVLEVVLHFGMGQGQEAFFNQRLHGDVCHFRRREDTVQAGHPAVRHPIEHPRANGLGTDHRDLDALMTVADSQPFGEPQRGVFALRCR